MSMRAASVLIALALAGCAAPIVAASPPTPTPPAPTPEEWVSVAALGGIDFIGQTHVLGWLGFHGVDAGCEGSAIYGVMVRKSQAARARELLLADPLGRSWIDSEERPRPSRAPPPPRRTFTVTIDRPYEKASTSTDLQPEWIAVLRERHVVAAARSCPRVVEFDVTEDPYIDAQGAWHVGYDVEVSMTTDPPGAGVWKLTFQVWDDGKSVMFQGGSRTGAAAF